MPAPTRWSEQSTIATTDRQDQELTLNQSDPVPFRIARTTRGSQVTSPSEYDPRPANGAARRPIRRPDPRLSPVSARDRDRDRDRDSRHDSPLSERRSPDSPKTPKSDKIYMPSNALQIPDFKPEDLVFYYSQLGSKMQPDPSTFDVVFAGYKPKHKPAIALGLKKPLVVEARFDLPGSDSDLEMFTSCTLVFADRRTYWEFVPEACTPTPGRASDRRDDRQDERRRADQRDDKDRRDGRKDDRRDRR